MRSTEVPKKLLAGLLAESRPETETEDNRTDTRAEPLRVEREVISRNAKLSSFRTEFELFTALEVTTSIRYD